MEKRTNKSKHRDNGYTEKFQSIALVKPTDLERFKSEKFQMQLLRESRKFGISKYNNSRLFRKVLEKLLKDPAEVMRFFEYEID